VLYGRPKSIAIATAWGLHILSVTIGKRERLELKVCPKDGDKDPFGSHRFFKDNITAAVEI